MRRRNEAAGRRPVPDATHLLTRTDLGYPTPIPDRTPSNPRRSSVEAAWDRGDNKVIIPEFVRRIAIDEDGFLDRCAHWRGTTARSEQMRQACAAGDYETAAELFNSQVDSPSAIDIGPLCNALTG